MKNSKKKQLWAVLILIILILVMIFLYRNNIEATYKGVDMKYIEEPKYCEQDSDCVIDGDACDVVNIYNYKESQFACQWSICNPSCNENNKCVHSTDCRGEEN